MITHKSWDVKRQRGKGNQSFLIFKISQSGITLFRFLSFRQFSLQWFTIFVKFSYWLKVGEKITHSNQIFPPWSSFNKFKISATDHCLIHFGQGYIHKLWVKVETRKLVRFKIWYRFVSAMTCNIYVLQKNMLILSGKIFMYISFGFL